MLPAAICGLVWIGEVPRESGFIWLLWREAACYATRKVIWVQLGGTHTPVFQFQFKLFASETATKRLQSLN